MKKDDLKTGNLVKLNNDRIYMVFKDSNEGNVLLRNSGRMSLNSYDDDLYYKDRHDSNWDVKEVYDGIIQDELTKLIMNTDFKPEVKSLIWRRVGNYKELTIKQIQEKLGYKIKIIE